LWSSNEAALNSPVPVRPLPLALVSGSASVYVNQDALGSILSLTNSSGAISDTFVYGVNGWGSPSHNSGTTALNLRFTGRDFDGSSGLYYFRARWYDSVKGRFISEDPIGFKGGLNLYRYADGNSINWNDPTGLRTFSCTKPLDVFQGFPNFPGSSGSPKSGPDLSLNPAFHRYLCVQQGGVTVCGGQDRATSVVRIAINIPTTLSIPASGNVGANDGLRPAFGMVAGSLRCPGCKLGRLWTDSKP
jgi:RHS repeat-associated protein